MSRESWPFIVKQSLWFVKTRKGAWATFWIAAAMPWVCLLLSKYVDSIFGLGMCWFFPCPLFVYLSIKWIDWHQEW